MSDPGNIDGWPSPAPAVKILKQQRAEATAGPEGLLALRQGSDGETPGARQSAAGLLAAAEAGEVVGLRRVRDQSAAQVAGVWALVTWAGESKFSHPGRRWCGGASGLVAPAGRG